MTRTNGRVGRLNTAGSAAAEEGIHPEVFREAAVIQMTWPGAPTLYYGDEAGLTGWTDPDNRRTYPWGHEDTALIVTADHGGHGRGHGADIPEDMTIPVFVKAPGFAPGSTLENVNIKDLAPTIATLMGVAPAAEWEGKSLI